MLLMSEACRIVFLNREIIDRYFRMGFFGTVIIWLMITPVCVTICHFHPACFLKSTSFSCFGRNLSKNGESISIFMRGHKRKPALRKITNYFGMRKDIKKSFWQRFLRADMITHTKKAKFVWWEEKLRFKFGNSVLFLLNLL